MITLFFSPAIVLAMLVSAAVARAAVAAAMAAARMWGYLQHVLIILALADGLYGSLLVDSHDRKLSSILLLMLLLILSSSPLQIICALPIRTAYSSNGGPLLLHPRPAAEQLRGLVPKDEAKQNISEVYQRFCYRLSKISLR